MKPRKVYIGDTDHQCGLNYQDQLIGFEISKRDIIVNKPEEADIILFLVSCSCTLENIHVFMEYVKEVLERVFDRSKVPVYLTGCLTRSFVIQNSYFDGIQKWINDTFDFVVPQNKPYQLLNMLYPEEFKKEKDYYGAWLHRDSEENEENLAENRLFLSTGCNNKCKFCKINYLSWPLQSVPLEDAKHGIDRIDELYPGSHLQIIGSNISQYGIDLYGKSRLSDVIEYVESKPNIKTFGFTGFNFYDANRFGLQDALRNCTKLSYIDGSLESGSNRILSLMGKNGTVDDFIAIVGEAQENKDIAIQLDLAVIAGFPTETMDDVMMTLEVLKEVDPYYVGICRYADNRFLPSHDLPQLPPEEIQYHARVMEKVLTRRKVYADIRMHSYNNNGKY